MLNKVCLYGRLGEIIDDTHRYIEIDRTKMFDNRDIVDYIPIMYWNPSPKSTLMTLKVGTLVVISGRLEGHEKLVFQVVCETISYAGPSKLKEM